MWLIASLYDSSFKVQRFEMGFTSSKDEMNGVYLNVQRPKHGSRVNLTIRCSICGRVFERSNNTLLRKDLSRCICDEFEKGEQYKQNRAKGKAVEDPYYSRCKTNFNVYLKEKLKKSPTLPCSALHRLPFWYIANGTASYLPFLRRKRQ
ncbi:MAG: hypothetical protein IKR52_03950 [Paludibacteraceae bacterium]|nr:hypothetical protein [Paludibacteraceae bacterium]